MSEDVQTDKQTDNQIKVGKCFINMQENNEVHDFFLWTLTSILGEDKMKRNIINVIAYTVLEVK